MTKVSFYLVVSCLFVSCNPGPLKNSGLGGPSPASIPLGAPQDIIATPAVEPLGLKVSVMAYNLENLFDDVRDSNETVIPSDILQKKLARLAQSILQLDGRGPDILMVEEVENLHVLQMLNSGYLQAAGYQTVELLESDDERGIDVGVLSRFPLVAGEATQLHRMPFSDVNTTRGILEVPLQLPDGKILQAFAYHFPSQANPVGQRRQAAETLRDLIKGVEANRYAVAGGDSNITTTEEQQQQFFHEVFADFQVSHLIGCVDCKGTYSYRKYWDFLDAILSREAGLIGASVKIPQRAPTQVNSDQTPRRFNAKSGEGMSDHFPIYAEVFLTPKEF
jgi:endonuclease/exonuclease/phosphatase family metal-dependent hydrolase